MHPGKDPHCLREHLVSVASQAGQFAEKFGCGRLGYIAGLCHDLGKADPKFQNYLRGKLRIHEGGHAYPSAYAAHRELRDLCFTVMGHHAGMPDEEAAQISLRKMHLSGLPAMEAIKAFMANLPEIGRSVFPEWASDDPLRKEFLIRMILSCLVDADRLDAEAYGDPELRKDWKPYPPLPDYSRRLASHLKDLQRKASANASSTTLEVRAEVLTQCRAAASHPRGFFRLTVPTGGGKTLSGLSFALGHAVHHDLDRVITAIPYTSIIEQTADVYRQIFEADSFLEHHSAESFSTRVNESDDDSPSKDAERQRRDSAIQNWDAPLILTTNVQLFESLLSNRPSRCRKLHNIVNSVIVLDEVQTLPPHLLTTILEVLKQLVAHYGCTVVFCTATQPDYSKILRDAQIDSHEIVSNYSQHFNLLKRVEFEYRPEPLTSRKFIEEFEQHEKILAILNSKTLAVEISRQIAQNGNTEGFFHLSTNLCGNDRRRVVEEVRARLLSKLPLPVRLLSTQVIEAGVDVDFPIVMRAAGPLDRIIQAAGRCNRGGLLDRGQVVIFHLDGEPMPTGAYTVAYQSTKLLLASPESLDSELAGKQYWNRLFSDVNTGQGIYDFNAARQGFNFKTVGENFKLINDSQASVIVKHPDMPEGLLERWGQMSGRAWFRRVQPFLVAVRDRRLAELMSEGVVSPHESGLMVLGEGYYDSSLGIASSIDPESLMA